GGGGGGVGGGGAGGGGDGCAGGGGKGGGGGHRCHDAGAEVVRHQRADGNRWAVDAVEAEGDRIVEDRVQDDAARPFLRRVPRREGHADAGLRRQVARHPVVVVTGDLQRRRRARLQVHDRRIDRDAGERRRHGNLDVQRVARGEQTSLGVEPHDDQVLLPHGRLGDVEIELRRWTGLLRERRSASRLAHHEDD